MTTAAAWQRTIDNLDADAFGKLVAAEVLEVPGVEAFAASPSRADLEVLLGMAALAGFRRLVDTVHMEAAIGDDADPLAEALTAMVDAVATARTLLLQPDGTAAAVDLLERILTSWENSNR